MFHTNGGWNCKKKHQILVPTFVQPLFISSHPCDLLHFSLFCLRCVYSTTALVSLLLLKRSFPFNYYRVTRTIPANEGWIFETWFFWNNLLIEQAVFLTFPHFGFRLYPQSSSLSLFFPTQLPTKTIHRRSIALSPSTKRCIKTGEPPE